MSWLQRLRVDTFLLVLVAVVILASLFPCEGNTKLFFEYLTTAAIALLFFMHGAKLSREAIIAGMGHWRLHLVVFLSTFALFPLLGLAMQALVPAGILTPTVYLGFLYLCALPATVQSAIAFTSVAGGNVAAAICSASASSISTALPLVITARRSHIWLMTPRSWLTMTKVRLRSRRACSRRFRISAWIEASSAEVGSSRSRIFGSRMSARAIAMRCRWPPESWCE